MRPRTETKQGFTTGGMGFRNQFAWQQSSGPNVRFGSKADIHQPPTDARFTPKSRHRNSVVECPLCAKSGHQAGYRGAHLDGAPAEFAFSIGAGGLRRLHRRLHLRLHGFQIEACSLLHRRKINRGLGKLAHLILYVNEAPELIAPPVRPINRLIQACALERVKSKFDKDRPSRP